MLENWETKIVGSKVILSKNIKFNEKHFDTIILQLSVPYCKHHVEKYHEWMKSPELQHLTGSEPLTLEQEYDMQRTWKESEDKCTFIILSKDIFDQTQNEVEAMVGDTNLFLQLDNCGRLTAEAEIMIAETKVRKQGLGLESMCLMLLYGMDQLEVKRYQVKIKEDNEPSIKMFEKLGFLKTAEKNVFGEIEFTASFDSPAFYDIISSHTISSKSLDKYIHTEK